ncbi:MAG: ABC transporter permease [Saprospiraceae bacterium]|nr:ABC transporter permease [Saprospiraceae bacterium]
MRTKGNTSLFIATRLAFTGDKSFTRIILGIAIVGLAISTAVMILSSAIISGFKNEVHEKIFGFWGHVHISDAGVTRNFDLRPMDVSPDLISKLKSVKTDDFATSDESIKGTIQSLFQTNEQYAAVTQVYPYIIMPCLLENKKDLLAGLFKGLSDDFNWKNLQRFMVAGHPPSGNHLESQIVISKIIANKLSLKVGDRLIVSFVKDNARLRRALTISGVYNTGLEEYDERFVLGSSELLRSVLGWDENQYSGLELFAAPHNDIPALNEFIYADILPSSMYCETIFEKFPNIFEWLNLQDINERVILQLMGLVAIINLTTVLLILILERTRMVGVLKALGASNWAISKIFYTMLLIFFSQAYWLAISWDWALPGFRKLQDGLNWMKPIIT